MVPKKAVEWSLGMRRICFVYPLQSTATHRNNQKAPYSSTSVPTVIDRKSPSKTCKMESLDGIRYQSLWYKTLKYEICTATMHVKNYPDNNFIQVFTRSLVYSEYWQVQWQHTQLHFKRSESCMALSGHTQRHST